MGGFCRRAYLSLIENIPSSYETIYRKFHWSIFLFSLCFVFLFIYYCFRLLSLFVWMKKLFFLVLDTPPGISPATPLLNLQDQSLTHSAPRPTGRIIFFFHFSHILRIFELFLQFYSFFHFYEAEFLISWTFYLEKFLLGQFFIGPNF